MKKAITVLLLITFTLSGLLAGCRQEAVYRIAFTTMLNDNEAIHLINSDGTDRIILTGSDNWNINPAWSPDGTKIAYASEGPTGYEIWVKDLSKSRAIQVTDNGLGNTTNPCWSPDGRKLLFTSNQDIYCCKISQGASNVSVGDLIRLTETGDNSEPRWSPDGKQILFISTRNGNPEIYRMNPDGSGQTNLTNNPATDQTPVWSPDGGWIAFCSNRDGNEEIYLMDATGMAPTNLTQNNAADFSPAWSPDGTRIAFVSSRDQNQEIYIVNCRNRTQTRLTFTDSPNNWPNWSPGGVEIAFASLQDGNWEIYLIKANGTRLRNLTKTLPISEFEPVCAPITLPGSKSQRALTLDNPLDNFPKLR
ncbi:MAG: DPP IV N-terminal domain-containing protein [Firmicutes bacterium]|nr:DPP IV N-terminal domain-containing protein [Bacillota bacterium]